MHLLVTSAVFVTAMTAESPPPALPQVAEAFMMVLVGQLFWQLPAMVNIDFDSPLNTYLLVLLAHRALHLGGTPSSLEVPVPVIHNFILILSTLTSHINSQHHPLLCLC